MKNDITRQEIVCLRIDLGGRVLLGIIGRRLKWLGELYAATKDKKTERLNQEDGINWFVFASASCRLDGWKEFDAMAGFQVLVKFIIHSVYSRSFVWCAVSMQKKTKGSHSILHKFKLLACIVTISVLCDKWSVNIIFCALIVSVAVHWACLSVQQTQISIFENAWTDMHEVHTNDGKLHSPRTRNNCSNSSNSRGSSSNKSDSKQWSLGGSENN